MTKKLDRCGECSNYDTEKESKSPIAKELNVSYCGVNDIIVINDWTLPQHCDSFTRREV